MIPGSRHVIRLPFPPSTIEAPRYGYQRPAHAGVAELLRRHETEYEQLLRGFSAYARDLQAIPLQRMHPREPHWRNGSLFGLDGVSLYCLTRTRQPRRYLEVGSGNSTLFVDRARRDGRFELHITSIDPSPLREIDFVCDAVIREPLERVPLDVFRDLRAGDTVFLDGTHRVFMNSDATAFFLDVLPSLPAGVLVGIHDIHLPDDYRPEHVRRYYSEQYLLASYLLAEGPWIQPLLPCWYVTHHPRLGGLVRELIPPAFLQAPPLRPSAPAGQDLEGVIFWLLTADRA